MYEWLNFDKLVKETNENEIKQSFVFLNGKKEIWDTLSYLMYEFLRTDKDKQKEQLKKEFKHTYRDPKKQIKNDLKLTQDFLSFIDRVLIPTNGNIKHPFCRDPHPLFEAIKDIEAELKNMIIDKYDKENAKRLGRADYEPFISDYAYYLKPMEYYSIIQDTLKPFGTKAQIDRFLRNISSIKKSYTV